MTISHPKRRLTRRHFLIGAGAVAGVGLLPAAWTWVSRFGVRPLALKVGLFTPNATSYPNLGDRVLAGIQAAKHPWIASLDVQSADIDVGFGKAMQQSQALLENANVDLVVAYVNTTVAARLQPLFENAKRPLIVLDSGANIVRAEQHSPFVYYNSLALWQSSYAAGRRLVEQHGPRVFIATAFFDSGYDSLNAVRQGVVDAGGEVVETYVTHLDPARNGVADAIEALRAMNPQSIYAHYSGKAASEFLSAYIDAGLTTALPLAGSGFMAEGSARDALGDRAAGFTTTLGWAADPTYAVEAVRYDPFAALGHDTVQFIGAAVEAAGEPAHWGDLSIQAPMTGARGPLALDAAHVLTGPITWRDSRRVYGMLANLAVEALLLPEAPAIPEMASSWLNPYLCG